MARASREEVEELREEIKSHLEKHPMGPSYFGHLAAKNSLLLNRFEEGFGCEKPTIAKVRKFMAKREAALGTQSKGANQ